MKFLVSSKPFLILICLAFMLGFTSSDSQEVSFPSKKLQINNCENEIFPDFFPNPTRMENSNDFIAIQRFERGVYLSLLSISFLYFSQIIFEKQLAFRFTNIPPPLS